MLKSKLSNHYYLIFCIIFKYLSWIAMKQFADTKLSCYADVMEKGLTLNSHFYP